MNLVFKMYQDVIVYDKDGNKVGNGFVIDFGNQKVAVKWEDRYGYEVFDYNKVQPI